MVAIARLASKEASPARFSWSLPAGCRPASASAESAVPYSMWRTTVLQGEDDRRQAEQQGAVDPGIARCALPVAARRAGSSMISTNRRKKAIRKLSLIANDSGR
jgi:hypothetical protein